MSTSEHETPLCRHSKIQVFHDAATQKLYAECEICGAVGPLRLAKKKAVEALKAIASYRDHGQGGYRENAGRPRSVPNSTKTRGFEIDDKRFNKFKKWVKREGFNKNSPALRWLFDNLEKIKVPKSQRAG